MISIFTFLPLIVLQVHHETQAISITKTNTRCHLNWERICPKTIGNRKDIYHAQNESFNFLDTPSVNCSVGKKCIGTRILGIQMSHSPWSSGNSTSCASYHLIDGNVLEREVDLLQEINCPSDLETFLHIALKITSGSECVLSVQEYRIGSPSSHTTTENSNNNCTIETDSILQSPYCFSYTCMFESNLLQRFTQNNSKQVVKGHSDAENGSPTTYFKEDAAHVSGKDVQPGRREPSQSYLVDRISKKKMREEAEVHSGPKLYVEPKAVPVKVKDARKGENKQEVIQRIKNPPSNFWNWRDNVLEITIFSILSAILILVGLKLCLSQKVNEKYQSARLALVKSGKNQMWFPHQRQNPLAGDKDKINVYFDRHKPPSKPILKNNFSVEMDMQKICRESGIHKFQKNKNKIITKGRGIRKQDVRRLSGNSNHSLPHVQNGTKLDLLEMKMRSFDSNSSIYYDTMDTPPQTDDQQLYFHFQPLIS